MDSIGTTMAADESRRIPGEPGVFVFVLIDMAVFAAIFLSFVVERWSDELLYNQSQATLDLNLGVVNTLVLLTNSWFIVLAIRAAKLDKIKQVPFFVSLTFICGLIFVVNKFYEYGAKIEAGITMTTNNFYMYYYLMTGLHFFHVFIGLIVLAVIWNKARRGAYSSANTYVLESGATYWHMVDLLWIVIFPLVFLLR